MKTVLTIAGSDSSGGAGIQADLKTMTMNGVYAMSAITALTAQNTTGVRAVEEASPEFLGQQIDAVFEDIYPDAVKIGMVASCELIRVIAEKLRYYRARNVVLDPVMVATSGSAKAAEQISSAYHCAVLLKGGHSVNDANDLLCADGKITWFEGKRIDNPNTHGTGCTLSSAIASNLAKEFTLAESVRRAKEYISGALAAMLDLGKGAGPMMHNFDLKSRFAEEAN